MDETTKRTVDMCANMLVHTTDFDNSRQAFSLDELNDRLYDYIDAVTDAYIAHKNSLYAVSKYTALMVLGIIATIVVMVPFVTFIVLACWGEIDTVVAIFVCLTIIGFIAYVVVQTDICNDKRKHYKMLADRMRINITDLYVSATVITWPLTHKENRQ